MVASNSFSVSNPFEDPRLMTARIRGKPLLEKNVPTKTKTKTDRNTTTKTYTQTKTDKNTTTKTWTQTKTKTDKKSARQHHPHLREASILKKHFSGPKQNTKKCIMITSPKTKVFSCYTKTQFCQMKICLKGYFTAITSLAESLSVRVIQCFFSSLQQRQWLFLPNTSLLHLRHPDWI